MSEELVKKEEVDLKLSTEEMDLVSCVEACELARGISNHTIQAIQLAKGMKDLKACLAHPSIYEIIEDMMNSPAGFMTDKDPKKNKAPYEKETVLDCCAQALSYGLALINNEFNIIADRMYPAQAGYDRKLREFKNEHRIKCGFVAEVPKLTGKVGNQNNYYCKSTAWWNSPSEGREEQELAWNLVGVSEDQVLGKVKKRSEQWLFNELSGNTWGTAEDYVDAKELAESIETSLVKKVTPEQVAKIEASLKVLGKDADLLIGKKPQYKTLADIEYDKFLVVMDSLEEMINAQEAKA